MLPEFSSSRFDRITRRFYPSITGCPDPLIHPVGNLAMYSLVLMSAMSTAPATAEFNGFFRDLFNGNCSGCTGCNGCNGAARYSCNGCCGGTMSASCNGCCGGLFSGE